MDLSEAFLNSYDLEFYLGRVLLDSKIDMEMKKKKYNFLSKYIFKELFVNEYMDDKEFWITVENGEDEVLDKTVLYRKEELL